MNERTEHVRTERDSRMPIITLTTDYGTQDGYVGALKGAILSVAPTVRIVDITHEIEPYSVLHGALVLKQVWPWFPPGTVHLCVVDPGVGTSRGVLVASFGERFVVAPDNGLLTLVARSESCDAMYFAANPKFFHESVSPTFHGRDVLAPIAAHLANGISIAEFGPRTERMTRLELPEPLVSPTLIRGHVLHVDRFGTLVTNVDGTVLRSPTSDSEPWVVVVDGVEIGAIRTTFGDVEPGNPVALIGSSGFLEIAVNQGRAVDRFGRSPSIEVRRV